MQRVPPSGIRLRTACPDDAPYIARLWKNSILVSCAEAYRFDLGYLKNWAASKTEEAVFRLMESEQWFITAERKKVIAGFFCATFEIGSFALFVAPEQQGNGVGMRLFSCYERTARECGVSVLSFSSSKNAVSFYERCGCVRTGYSDLYSVGMRKELR